MDELGFPAVWLWGERNGAWIDIWRQLFEKLGLSVYIQTIGLSDHAYQVTKFRKCVGELHCYPYHAIWASTPKQHDHRGAARGTCERLREILAPCSLRGALILWENIE